MNTTARFEAEDHWKKARRQMLYNEVVCIIKRCSVDMLSFEQVRGSLHLRQKLERGLQEIPLDRIRGSVGRHQDFTDAFLPRKEFLKERWLNVDQAMMAGKTPPIDVYQVGEAYFVVDGNHRVSAARAQGRPTIDAYVTEFVTPVPVSGEVDLEELLIKSEQAEFLEQIGRENRATAQALTFTCSGCFRTVADQVEQYRAGAEERDGKPVSRQEAFKGWHEEVFVPSVETIRRRQLMELFPGRTEADLFVWAQQNRAELEELVLEDSSEPG